MTKDEILEIMWAKEGPHLYLTKEEFMDHFEDWDMITHPPCPPPEFVAFVKGPAFHFMSMGMRKPLSLKAIKEFLEKIINEEGYASTKTPVDDERQRRFNEAIGFEKVAEDEFYVHYKIEKVK